MTMDDLPTAASPTTRINESAHAWCTRRIRHLAPGNASADEAQMKLAKKASPSKTSFTCMGLSVDPEASPVSAIVLASLRRQRFDSYVARRSTRLE